MELTITPEFRAELRLIIDQELERRSRERCDSRTMYQRICKGFEPDLARYEYDDDWSARLKDGTVVSSTAHRDNRSNVRSAIGTLLKAAYRVNRTDKLPADSEPQVKEFIRSVLDSMASLEQKGAPSGADNT